MIRAKLGKEIVLRVANEIGILYQVSKVIAEKGVNVVAVHGTVEDGHAVLRFVTTDNLRIGDALRARNYAPEERDCLLVEMPNKPGVLRGITEKLLAEDVDIHHLYATAGETVDTSLVVLASPHHDRAMVALNR